MNPPDNSLWRSFQDGVKYRLDGSDRIVTMRSEDAGSIRLSSGRIVASDPLLDPWRRPFSISVPPGSYSVHLALGDEAVALVMVLFMQGEPIRWKNAKPQSFSVDSATACLMDHDVARLLRRKATAGKYHRYTRWFEDALAETGWANVGVDQVSEANLVLFHTWAGDGTFPVSFGYDAQEELICLVVDMLVGPCGVEPVSD